MRRPGRPLALRFRIASALRERRARVWAWAPAPLPEARPWEEALLPLVAPRASWVAEVAGAAWESPPALRSCLARQLGGQEVGQPWGQEAGQPGAARVDMAVQPRP